jgi:hypothetical protein
MTRTMLRLLYLGLDLVDVRLQLVVVQAVRDWVGGKVEEGHEDGRHVVLVLCDPRWRNDTIWEYGGSRRERRYGRVQGPRGRGSNRGAAWRSCRGRGGIISLLWWQLKGLARVSTPARALATCTDLPSLQHGS